MGQQELPTAVARFKDGPDECIAQPRFLIIHRRSIRTTNLLERLFYEERRRMKIVANAFGEWTVLKLTYASLIRGSERRRGLCVGPFEAKRFKSEPFSRNPWSGESMQVSPMNLRP